MESWSKFCNCNEGATFEAKSLEFQLRRDVPALKRSVVLGIKRIMETADAGSSVPGEYMPRGQAAPENITPRLRSIARNQVSKELETVTLLPGSNGKLRVRPRNHG